MAENQLYVVATPIGNLADISQRAHQVFEAVDVIAAEDTRHTRRLLNHLGINKELLALHDHNESKVSGAIVSKLAAGGSVALVSDAGTPLIADPGYHLIQDVVQAGFNVVPVPGACAVITALCASALPTDRFIFDGFLPAKTTARSQYFKDIAEETRTLVVYESPHRIIASLNDLLNELGSDREIVVARELTKTFETFLRGPVASVMDQMQADSNQQKGEFVVMIRGAKDNKHLEVSAEAISLLKVLMTELPLKQAAALTAKATGFKKNKLYQIGLEGAGD